MADIIVKNVYSKIEKLNDIKVADALDNLLSFYVEGYQYTKAFRNGWYDKNASQFRHWDGKKHILTSKMVFPTGLLVKVCEFLKSQNIEANIIDRRPPIVHGDKLKLKNFTPRAYQVEAVEKALEKGRGIIRVATGGGKTGISAMIVANYNVPTMVYVIGKDLLYQFHEEYTKMLGSEIGLIGDGRCSIKQINICSIWTAVTAFDLNTKASIDDEDWQPEISIIDEKVKNQIREVVQNSNLAIFDEAHYIATDTIQSIYKASGNCKYVIGMSGTDWRESGDDILIEAVCGPRIYNMPASKLIENGFLVRPKIRIIDVPKPIKKISKNTSYHEVYSKYIVENIERNKLIVDTANILISKGRKVLILIKQIDHGNKLLESLPDNAVFVCGSLSSDERKEIRQRIKNNEINCIVASSVYDIGVDLPELDALILAGGGKSSIRALQRIGRVIRKAENKIDAIVVDFFDNCKYLQKHSIKRIAIYKTEPMFMIKGINGLDDDINTEIQKLSEKITG